MAKGISILPPATISLFPPSSVENPLPVDFAHCPCKGADPLYSSGNNVQKDSLKKE
jgi:hypothetical protein